MYPEPPHLMITVYGAQDEYEAFATISTTVEATGGRPTGLVEVAPRGQDFRLVSDLGDVSSVLMLEHRAAADLIAGRDVKSRVVKASYSHPQFGDLILSYLLNGAGDRHPIAVVTSAGALGLPTDSWTEEDQTEVRQLVDKSRELLRTIVATTNSLYGGIGVETRLATPTNLRTPDVNFPTELYVSRILLDGDAAATAQLTAVFANGEVSEWENGNFYAAWAPFVRRESQTFDYRAISSESRTILAHLLKCANYI